VTSGLPYRWGDLGVPKHCEAGVVRRLRCLEAASGLAGAQLCPANPVGSMHGTAGAAASASPSVASDSHPTHGPIARAEALARGRGGGVWCVQAAIDADGCITCHPAQAQLEWPTGHASQWPDAVTTITLPLPLSSSAVDAAFLELGSADDSHAASVAAPHKWCVMAHLGRMGLRGITVPASSAAAST
jgi:hypothetical protein